MLDFNNQETLMVFRQFLRKNGINGLLRENDVQDGDIIVIGEKDFVFEDEE